MYYSVYFSKIKINFCLEGLVTKIIDVHTYCLWKRILLVMGIWDSVCLMSKEKREIKC